ncbi:MAG: GntR family transcriptional regulator [Chloroflexi bacterium RBG_13_48_10]|nr:MAG: GntR family transcriptional regulator [Chloroflexi bacterium RBG_13_48_10]
MNQRKQDTFLYEQVASDLGELIRQGTFRAGERIPSVRQLSRQRKISITTVLQAYMLLENQGLIETRPQSGYYVRSRLPQLLPEPEMSTPQQDPTLVSVRELVMMVLKDSTNPGLIQLGAAIPNTELVIPTKLNRIMTAISRQTEHQYNTYEIPPGNEALRIQIAQRAVGIGCNLTQADIVTTSGCLEAFTLSLRAVCRPGDTVAIESPMYFGILQVLESLDLRALEIPTHPRDGISISALKFAIEHNSIQACLVLSNFNNPLGSCIPDENKQTLVGLLNHHEIPLIEGDVCGEIYFSGVRPGLCKAYDRKGLVLLCSSFSKDLVPGYRVGWVVPGRFKSTIEWLKYTTNVATATLPQVAIAKFLESGGYDHHLRSIRRLYASFVAQLSHAVERYFPEGTRVTRPNGGIVLWVQLPDYADSLELYKQALQAGITLAPGYIFSATHQYKNFIRLNAAWWSYETDRAMRRLGELVAEQKRSV